MKRSFFLFKDNKHLSTLTMILSLDNSFIIATIFFLNIELCICVCARAEYEINGECCPMCSPGNRVYRHCTEFTSTTCMQCVDLTYTDEPNGLINCISCTVCDSGQGLRIKTACTLISDTVCEPLDGFYCTEEHRQSCRYAIQHTKCSPGQYIKQKGTAVKDAECATCADGTYSNGSFHLCKQHTKCEDLGLTEESPGTKSCDAECGGKTHVDLIAGIVVAVIVILILVAVAIVLFLKRQKKKCTDRTKEINQERDSSSILIRTDRMNMHKSGHVTFAVENDEEQFCSETQTSDGVT